MCSTQVALTITIVIIKKIATVPGVSTFGPAVVPLDGGNADLFVIMPNNWA